MKRSEAIRLRAVVEQAVQSLDDATALTAVTLYPQWRADTAYSVGAKTRYNGRLWRCVQAHTAQTGWEPEIAPSLWEQINESHAGTREDPIPYDGALALESGKYYIQAAVVYLCIRDTVSPVYNALADLVGLYVEVAV